MELTERSLDRETTALGELELRELRTEDGEIGYGIYLDGSFLMGSHGSHSERLMAPLARELISTDAGELTVLVGGLGAGHTLRAVLELPGAARVDVAEIGRAVVRWNRSWLAPFNGHAVDDPRVRVVIDDVRRVLAHRPRSYDMILLDVDNGPGWLASEGNRRLYTTEGLRLCREALRAGGVLAVWSPSRNRQLHEGLQAAFGTGWEGVSTRDVARRAGEPASVIYLITPDTPV